MQALYRQFFMPHQTHMHNGILAEHALAIYTNPLKATLQLGVKHLSMAGKARTKVLLATACPV